MKNLFLLFALLTTSLTAAYGQAYEVRSIKELVSEIRNSKFSYKETGLVTGFNSIQSCMYVASEMVIFKNYCFPKRNYPARGYTIISAKFGMIDIYEEKFDAITKRDILQNEFSKILAPYLRTPFPQTTMNDLNEMIEALYAEYYPGCWSTNWSYYSHIPEAVCSPAAGEVIGFNSWAQETQALTDDVQEWNGFFDIIEKQLSL
jgi:hypothetical protein